ncbi:MULTISPECIES: TrmH family RNA methyltransferase [unclassified Lentilitoribacter]|jgi:23S rRNA (guanosine2251-2'-O)-methyltransferase|uniref:TrmH family RNA methyltransferase n=1 Tax=unclassified Lentilitoribacter TaxID=2647570 RepID=UPI0013A69FEC|nr:RNA methyltransferase [Lentilitoribacter sp. Alg239-R112]
MRERKDKRSPRKGTSGAPSRRNAGPKAGKPPAKNKNSAKQGQKSGGLAAAKKASGLFSPQSLNPDGKTTGRPNVREGAREGTSRQERRERVYIDDSPRPREKSTRASRYRNRGNSALYLYGLHTVRAAIENPRRKIIKLLATENAWERLDVGNAGQMPCPVEFTDGRNLDRLVGKDAIHQGIVAEAHPLRPKSLDQLKDTQLIVVLDEVTDPHNVGAIMRSAVALGAGAIISTMRNSAQESGVLAKSASGALEMIDHIEVKNLGEAIDELHFVGFQTIGLDSEGPEDLVETFSSQQIALVLGAEGKGLRHKTREIVSDLARLDMPGPIKSLNVSNAAALSLYAAHRFLLRQP